MQRITQQDVADAAGVTRATVSYVLNNGSVGRDRISDATRERILSAAKKLGYRVNLSARSLKTNRTQLIAMLVPDLGNPFYPMQIKGAQLAAQKAGYRLVIFDSSSSEEGERDFLDMALHHLADGLLLSSFHLSHDDIALLSQDGIPCVGLVEGLKDSGLDLILTDQARAVESLLAHLWDRGHRRIAHLTGDLSSANGLIRRDAYRAVLRTKGFEPRPSWELEGTFLREGTAELVSRWYFGMPASERPTALFAANDVMALEAVKVLKKGGVNIPGDLAICGYDDIPETLHIDPPLTTIGQDNQAIGHEATRLLIDRIEGRHHADPIVTFFPSHLKIREST